MNRAATEVVDLRLVASRVIEGQIAPDADEDGRADGEVEEEDERPADGVGDDTADGGPDEDREPEDGAEESLVPTSLGRREQVTDDRQRDREQRSGTESLDAPGRDELPHLLGQAGEERADHEDADPEQEDRPPAEQVGELAVERSADRGREQVGGERPRVEVVATEVGDDPWQRRSDHRLVECREEDADHDRAEDAHSDGVGELDRWAVHRSEPCLHRLGHLALLLLRMSRCYRPIRPVSFLMSW